MHRAMVSGHGIGPCTGPCTGLWYRAMDKQHFQARFYGVEIVLALRHLHNEGIGHVSRHVFRHVPRHVVGMHQGMCSDMCLDTGRVWPWPRAVPSQHYFSNSRRKGGTHVGRRSVWTRVETSTSTCVLQDLHIQGSVHAHVETLV